jgi:hypothetical protein
MFTYTLHEMRDPVGVVYFFWHRLCVFGHHKWPYVMVCDTLFSQS